MDVPFSTDEQARIDEIASSTGQGAAQFVREVMNGYFEELDEVRHTLRTRYDDIKSGRVMPVDGEEIFAKLRRRSEQLRARR